MGASQRAPGQGPEQDSGTFVGDWPQHQGQGLQATVGGRLAAAGEPKFPLMGTRSSVTEGGWLGGHGSGPSCHCHPGLCWLSVTPLLCVLTQASV